jgi:vacuolar protein sorting-associated protein 72
MKSMLANEEPDSDLELLFAEDEDDQGFTDVGEDASDAHMDSSDDEDDAAGGKGSDFEGEKELEQQAKEKRAAQRKKRNAQDAIPARFRKKVRIDPTTTTTTTATTASSASTTPRPVSHPPPRPKKKSERASWLPSVADQPTRASLRQTTRLSKEQLHAQMEEREARRLKQMAQMQKKAERLEAMKKPPMTQEERLREAEIVERRNSKSLNRWEEAEKQREEERLAKLAALNQRTLKGPVITFWSGTREWKDGGAARYVVLEEKPKRKPREKKDKSKDKDKDKAGNLDAPQDTAAKEGIPGQEVKPGTVEAPSPPTQPKQENVEEKITRETPQEPSAPAQEPVSMAMPPQPQNPSGSPSLAAPTPAPPSGLAAPAPPPQSNSPDTRTPGSKPSGILAAPVLAPPTGVDPGSKEDAAPSSRQSPAGSALAAPSPQHPQPQAQAPPLVEPQPQITMPKVHEHLLDSLPAPSNTPSEAPAEAPASAEDTTYTRNAIVYQNFDENLIKDKAIQTQILFGRKMNKLSSTFYHHLHPVSSHMCSASNNGNRASSTPHMRHHEPSSKV